MQTPLPPEPLPIPADEGTIVLPIGKQKRISHSFRNKSIEKRNHSKIPFAANDFGTSSKSGVSRERFRGHSEGAVSSSDADELESNRFSARFGAWVTPLPVVGVENVFLPAASTPAIEAFSVGLSPEDLAVNFVMCFKGLARASS
jgi:hypothetical protein